MQASCRAGNTINGRAILPRETAEPVRFAGVHVGESDRFHRLVQSLRTLIQLQPISSVPATCAIGLWRGSRYSSPPAGPLLRCICLFAILCESERLCGAHDSCVGVNTASEIACRGLWMHLNVTPHVDRHPTPVCCILSARGDICRLSESSSSFLKKKKTTS